MNKIILITMVLFSLIFSLYASDVDTKHLTIDRIEQTELYGKNIDLDSLNFYLSIPPLPLPGGNPSSEISIIDIVRIGKEVWKFIEDRKPVVDIKVDNVAAIPSGVKDWSKLENWRGPGSKDYLISATNLYGMEVIRLHYRVIWMWGGQYKKKGQYLKDVTIAPVDIQVTWGYNLNVVVSVSDVLNIGTNNDPIAGLRINFEYEIKTVVKEARGCHPYFIRGDGIFQVIE